MLPYTGEYIGHIDNNKNNLKYYTFAPRPLMHGDMYKMDDELSALLIEVHRNIYIKIKTNISSCSGPRNIAVDLFGVLS